VEKENPQAAILTLIEDRFVSLLVLRPHPSQPLSRRAVPHIDDPELLKRTPQARRDRGAWRFIPGHEYPQPELVGDLVPSYQSDQQLTDDEVRVLYLHDTGQAPAQIAKELGEPWTHQKIGQVLKRLKSQNVATES
jgi:hypothetical protein